MTEVSAQKVSALEEFVMFWEGAFVVGLHHGLLTFLPKCVIVGDNGLVPWRIEDGKTSRG